METTSTSRRAIIITAVLALCISVIISSYNAYKHKQALKGNEDVTQTINKRAHPSQGRQSGNPVKQDIYKSKRSGWGSSYLPIFSVGILGYAIYILSKIMQKKYSGSRNQMILKSDRKKRQKGKTKITMHEIQQLEQKLQETEAAFQKIIEQSNLTVEAAAKVLDESDSSAGETSASSCKLQKSTSSSDSDSCAWAATHDATSRLSTSNTKARRAIRKRRRKRSNQTHKEGSSHDSGPENSLSVEESINISSAGLYETSSDNCLESGPATPVEMSTHDTSSEELSQTVKGNLSELQIVETQICPEQS